MVSQLKGILIGAFVFSASWILLILMYNMVVEGSHLYQLADHNTYYMIAEAGTFLLIYCLLFIPVKMIADKYRFDRGFIWVSAIPYVVCSSLTIFSFAVLLVSKDAYTICKKNDTDRQCQCKVDYLRHHFPKSHYLYHEIDKIDDVIVLGGESSRKTRKFNLSDDDKKVFLNAEEKCQ